MGNGKYQLNMCEGSMLKNTFRFAIPLMFENILHLLYNAADLVVVSRFAGSGAMAAVGATGTLAALLVNVFTNLSVGANVVVARNYGAKDDEGIRRTVHTAIPFGALAGIFACLIGVLFSPTFLVWMGTPAGGVLEGATLYMRIYFFGIPALLVFGFGAAILRAVGDTKRPLYILSASGFINVILNVILVVSFHMDVAGVAIATVVSNYLSAFAVLFVLIRTEGVIRLDFRKMKFYKKELGEILKVGVPVGLQSSAYAFSNTVVQSGVNSFGAAVIAGNSACANLESFIYGAIHAFSQATTIGVSQNYGAKNEKRINKAIYIPLLCSSVISLALSGLALLFSRQLLGIYIADSPEAIEAGMVRMMINFCPYFLLGITDCLQGALRALGCTNIPTISTFACTCGLRILWVIFVLPLNRILGFLYLVWPISWVAVVLCDVVTLAIVKPRALRKMRESI